MRFQATRDQNIDVDFDTDQGTLRVDLLDGRDIHAADRGGKHDAADFVSFSEQFIIRKI